MERFNSGTGPDGLHHDAAASYGLSKDHRRGSRVSELPTQGGKAGKIRWLSQLKEWVLVSEPSTRALRNYKKDTYKKAGIARDDPLANVKLHLPVASLPPDAIKPGGRGPEPEEIAIQRASHRKRAHKLSLVSGAPPGPRSSASHSSTLSSVTTPKDEE
ncbi:hypothetical protein SAMD00023353_0303030 [Rosellinia necatrix]|uniref:Uncharacterized protein n=1 Tax=Rosellinia necatrix TaxID=77044 RepID=A0A1W2TDU6_ROSNE|nr:hypothetical protein SAMD00023353_0303030 [Rosellinia necatrix]